MLKTEALRLLGGTTTSAAAEIGITPSAVSQWPEVLPPAIADRVQAAIARRLLAPELIGAEGAPTPSKAEA